MDSFRDRKRHIEWFKQRFKGRTLLSISVHDVTEFREELDDLATQTINHYHAALKHLLGLAASSQYKLIPSNNAVEVPMPDPKNQRSEMLSVEEWAALRDELATHLKEIVLVAYTCGPRKGEILTLEWPNVDLNQRVFVLNKTKNGEPRTVPILTEEVYDTFQRLSKVRRLDTKRVFLYEGKSIAGIKTGFTAACRRSGVLENHKENGFTFHDLRHCSATNMRRAGIPSSVVMKIMGWKSIEMYKRYDKIEPRDFHHASKALSAYLESNTVITPARFHERVATVSV